MTVIHWFRKGLRLHDNPALLKALQPICGNVHELRPVYILDPWFAKHANVGVNRWRFLMQTLEDLDASLRKMGSRLFVLRGKPEEVLEKVFQEWKVKRLTYEVDSEPYAKKRDLLIQDLAKKHSVEMVAEHSHTLYSLEDLIKTNGGTAPLTYQSFLKLCNKKGPPNKPVETVKELPDACKTKVSDSKYNVPTLKEIDIDESTLHPCLIPGGESVALQRLDQSLKDKKWVRNFEKPKTSPNSLEASTTVLSPHLKFGCLSARTMYWRLAEIVSEGPHSQPPVSLTGQLLWREFFYTCGSYIPNFDKMEGNPICKQVDWDTNDEYLSAWREARTGYPYIDAIMTKLRQEGWIHHLARHSVACFLTRGDLWISWEEGQKVFEELLLDADWSLNAGNWMWLSASAFFHQYFRVYSPVAFGKKTDKNGDFIRKYIPVLKKMPAAYIYEPWEAPVSVQKQAGCVLGVDYPRRIIKHEVVSKTNIGRMKKAYDASKGVSSSSDAPSPAKSKSPVKRKKESGNAKITKFLKK